MQPLWGGYGTYIEELERIRRYIDKKPVLTKDDLIAWYFKRTAAARAYINALFKYGLLKERDRGIECKFPRRNNRNRRIIEIINDHVVYVLDMLNEARDGATEEQLHEIGKKKYGLSKKSHIKEIRWRRGWLESAQVLELRGDKLLHPTELGRHVLDEHFGSSPPKSPRRESVNKAEFGGKGEGANHRTLKELVCSVAEEVCGAKVRHREMEYPLLSGDKVDVTAWNAKNIWHIEVKSCTSGDADIERGLYQCIKYGTVGEAMEKVQSSNRKVRSLLVVENKLSEENKVLKEQLGVRVHRIPRSMRRKLRTMRRNTRG